MVEGHVQGLPRLLLRAEGAALFLAAVSGYSWTGHSWWILAALILAPDLSMLAYLVRPGIGALVYNAAHSTVGPLLLLCLAAASGTSLGSALALIWLAHVGFDRALGYGLKYGGGFHRTHLGPVGAARHPSGPEPKLTAGP